MRRSLIFLSEVLIGKTDEESMQNATKYLHENETACQLGDIIVLGGVERGFDICDIKNKFGWDGYKAVPVYKEGDDIYESLQVAGVPAFVISHENGLEPDNWADMLLDGNDVMVFFSQDIKNEIAIAGNTTKIPYYNIPISINGGQWSFYINHYNQLESDNKHFYFIDLQEALRNGRQEVKFHWHYGRKNIRIVYSFDRAERFIELMTQFKNGTLYRKKKMIDELRNYRFMVSEKTREMLDNFYLKHIMKTSNRISMDIWRSISRY